MGSSNSGALAVHAVLWDRGVVVDLGRLPGTELCSASAINNRRQIAGTCDNLGFLWEDGRMTQLGPLPGGDVTGPNAINMSGQIAGREQTALVTYAFLWDKGAMVDLGTLPGGSSSTATGINNRGAVVRTSFATVFEGPGQTSAVLWDRATIAGRAAWRRLRDRLGDQQLRRHRRRGGHAGR